MFYSSYEKKACFLLEERGERLVVGGLYGGLEGFCWGLGWGLGDDGCGE